MRSILVSSGNTDVIQSNADCTRTAGAGVCRGKVKVRVMGRGTLGQGRGRGGSM